eukprot:TRINITY_DN25737_c0_g1_i2.p1 TRINITY_DN25737_c0_g1~~TRINITY_DN25737_c0_g1_i2.p1  ORF type:complete len:486 (+),score=95.45 TRINITY_DN25737_c0_g1_i2:29-1486(+)
MSAPSSSCARGCSAAHHRTEIGGSRERERKRTRKVDHRFRDNHGMIYGTTATFGAPYYGERVLGQLLYAESKGKDHCDDSDYDLPEPSRGHSALPARKSHQELVKVVLVRRGQCTFVTKVRVAQEKGAHAVVVVDRATSMKTPEEIQHIVMSDDGWGDSVTIPSMLISRSEGQKLIDAAVKQPLVVELVWDIPRGEVVIVDFWMSSASREAGKFLVLFKDCADILKYRLQFVPHYHIFGLPEGAGAGHLCIDKGSEICAPDPDGPGPITGEDVVNEDARQLCIWNTTARSEKPAGATYSAVFWQYIDSFSSRCKLEGSSDKSRFGDKCSWQVMMDVGIDVPSVQDCLRKYRISFLKEQLQSVAWSPLALRLNGWRYSGPLDPETVLKAVCAGYSTVPEECASLMDSRPGFLLKVANGLSFGSFMAALFATVLLVCGVFYTYKRHITSSARKVLREEVMLEVQSQMADYVPMEDGNRPPSQRLLSF